MNRPREGTVHNLQELYTVAVGIALALAVGELMQGADGDPIYWTRVPTFVAFLATLIPFYHGAMRHLDEVYIQEGGRYVRGGALLADFLLLFLEACFFFVIARLLGEARSAAWALVALLTLDAGWGLAVHLLFVRSQTRWAEVRWVVINSVAAPTLAIALVATSSMAKQEDLAATIIGVVAVARTIGDYWWSWRLYFPP